MVSALASFGFVVFGLGCALAFCLTMFYLALWLLYGIVTVVADVVVGAYQLARRVGRRLRQPIRA